MLELVIYQPEQYDEEKEKFIEPKTHILKLEHSLVSISNWESNWCKPFLTKNSKTIEEWIDYIRCMTITQNVDPSAYNFITNDHMQQITKYMDAPMTATTVPKDNSSPNREVVTSELIYYWMIAHNIPPVYEKWHLNRLLMLINVCNYKNKPHKKMSQSELAKHHRSVNASRRKPRK